MIPAGPWSAVHRVLLQEFLVPVEIDLRLFCAGVRALALETVGLPDSNREGQHMQFDTPDTACVSL